MVTVWKDDPRKRVVIETETILGPQLVTDEHGVAINILQELHVADDASLYISTIMEKFSIMEVKAWVFPKKERFDKTVMPGDGSHTADATAYSMFVSRQRGKNWNDAFRGSEAVSQKDVNWGKPGRHRK